MPRTFHVTIATTAVLALTAGLVDAQGSRRSSSAQDADAPAQAAPAQPTPVEPAPVEPPATPPAPDPEPEPEAPVSEPELPAPTANSGQGIPNFGLSGDAPPAPPPGGATLPNFGFADTAPDAAATEDAAPDAAKLPAPTPPPDGIQFGDDTSEYANDGECDDRRFRGSIMATSLTLEHTGHDASDCRNGLSQGLLSLWDFNRSVAATICAEVDFGNDTGEYAEDEQCDDPRFEGVGMATVLRPDDSGVDASDCSRLCALGMIGLRDY